MAVAAIAAVAVRQYDLLDDALQVGVADLVAADGDAEGAWALCRSLRKRDAPLSPLLVLVAESQLAELDLNPVIVSATGAVAVDNLVVANDGSAPAAGH